MTPAVRDILLTDTFSPLKLGGNAAIYDIQGAASDRTYITAGGLVPVVADQSPFSAVNALVTNGGASNSLSAPNVSTTGDQTFSFDAAFADYTPASDRTLVNKLSGNDGFQILLLTTGVLRLRVGDGSSVTNVDSTAAVGITDLARGQFQIIWEDGVGATYTKNGAPLGNPVPAVKTLTNAAVACVVDLTFAGVLYSFTCSTYTCNPSGAAKSFTTGAGNTFVAPTTGETWTITSTGDTGARIGGARDLVQLTVAKQPAFSTGADGINILTGDGSNDYMQAAIFAANGDSIQGYIVASSNNAIVAGVGLARIFNTSPAASEDNRNYIGIGTDSYGSGNWGGVFGDTTARVYGATPTTRSVLAFGRSTSEYAMRKNLDAQVSGAATVAGNPSSVRVTLFGDANGYLAGTMSAALVRSAFDSAALGLRIARWFMRKFKVIQ